MFKDFIHLHCHSEYSRFDGLNKMNQWVMYARSLGFKSLAITDHGNVGGWIAFYKECKKTKNKDNTEIPYPTIKPILGQEFYLARDHTSRGIAEQPDGRKGNRHIILLAKNQKGYENLCTLSQKGFVDGQAFGDPRIDLNLLYEHREGLICSSACLSSVVNNNLLLGRYDLAKKSATLFKDIFGDDFYLEVMCHGIDKEILIIPDIIKLGKELNIKVIATNDCHYCKKEQAQSQQLLMAMNMSRCIKDPKAYKHPYDEFYLKTPEEMYKIFGTHKEVLTNTLLVDEKVEDFLKFTGNTRLPSFSIEVGKHLQYCLENNIDFDSTELAQKIYKEVADGNFGASVSNIVSSNEAAKNAHAFLTELAKKGLERLGWHKSEKHKKQLEVELNDVRIAWDSNKKDFATYILMVWQGIMYGKNKKILTGCGRGSGYASVLLRVIGITYGPDPLEYGLIWERFLSFDDIYVLNDSDWGIGEQAQAEIDINSLEEEEEDAESPDESGIQRY